MGHESPIEPWLAPDNRAAGGLRTDWLRRVKVMKTAGRENQKRCATVRSVPRSRNGRPEQSWSTRWAGSQEKIRPQEKCFSLDSFYRTNRDLICFHLIFFAIRSPNPVRTMKWLTLPVSSLT